MNEFTASVLGLSIHYRRLRRVVYHLVKDMPVDFIDPPSWTLMGVRVESSIDARLFGWLLNSVGTEQVRFAARRSRTRLAPKPMKVARELGAEVPGWLRPSDQRPRAC